MHTHLILERLYRLPPWRPRRRLLKRLLNSVVAFVQRYTTWLTVGSVVFSVLIGSHIYYYNELLDLQSNVETSRAQIEVAQQRRNHIQRNMMQLLRFYARYERDVLKDVTTLRTDEKAEKAATPLQALARLDAVAEQYPNLQLNHTVQQFSDSIVASETMIATRAAEYNEAVNIYTNVLNQFPGNVFGPLLGFRNEGYYTPEDPSVLEYHELTP